MTDMYYINLHRALRHLHGALFALNRAFTRQTDMYARENLQRASMYALRVQESTSLTHDVGECKELAVYVREVCERTLTALDPTRSDMDVTEDVRSIAYAMDVHVGQHVGTPTCPEHAYPCDTYLHDDLC